MNALNCVYSDLNPADYNPIRITKADKDFSKRLAFKKFQ